ncbi:MAG: type I phosphomannose isomerase catalytic subunit [Polyangiales bacterium]
MLIRPTLLCPDNFTPASRTPWGGTRLLREFKHNLGIEDALDRTVGESWELSAGPEFPSMTQAGERLSTVVAANPEAWLGDEARTGGTGTALLVKWLDARDDLSLQIHPEDDYRGLATDEAGKLEAWYVVAHEPGAGLYLGFRPGVGEADVRRMLGADGDLRTLMRFETVARGDFVLLTPGTPHAVGRGVTLIEPQHVAPGHRGVTYRYWDFGRRYDAAGRLDPNGKPRELHLEHALAVTRFDTRGELRARCRWPALDHGARCELLSGPEPDAALRSTRLRVARAYGTGQSQLPAWNALRAVTVIEGAAVIGSGAEAVTVEAGRTLAVPAACGPIAVMLDRAHLLLAAACASG